MAFDEGLATRIRELLGDQPGLVEKRMFGGLAMLLDGNMAVGVYGDSLIVRADPGRQDELLTRPGTRVFDVTGRPMRGWLLVDPLGVAEDGDLRGWLDLATAFARTLPPK